MNWNKYMLEIAKAVSLKSKEEVKVGTVIVTDAYEPISFGYNGILRKGNEEMYNSRNRANIVIHSEMNALLFAKQALKGARLFTTIAPCSNCLKHIVQSGITSIGYGLIFPPNKLKRFKNKAFLMKDKEEVILMDILLNSIKINLYNIYTEISYQEELTNGTSI